MATNRTPVPDAGVAAELTAASVLSRLPWRVAGRIALIAVIVGLAACSQRAGDLGRQRSDYLTRNVYDPIDRRLLTGGAIEMSKLPLSDEERRMYNVLWRFFSAPQAREWTAFGTSRISPIDLATGKSDEKTDRYYAWLKRSNFQSSRARYNAVAGHVAADVQTIASAFDAVCAVMRLDTRRRTAVDAFPDLGADEQEQVELRLKENAIAVANFALALDYRYQSYSYALKRLLVETPDEAARTVDAGLSALGTKVDAARARDYCGPASRGGSVVLSYGNFG